MTQTVWEPGPTSAIMAPWLTMTIFVDLLALGRLSTKFDLLPTTKIGLGYNPASELFHLNKTLREDFSLLLNGSCRIARYLWDSDSTFERRCKLSHVAAKFFFFIMARPVCFIFERARAPRHFLLGKGYPMRKLQNSTGAFKGHQDNRLRCLREVSGLHGYHQFQSSIIWKKDYSKRLWLPRRCHL